VTGRGARADVGLSALGGATPHGTRAARPRHGRPTSGEGRVFGAPAVTAQVAQPAFDECQTGVYGDFRNPLNGSRAAISCCSEASTKALEAVPKASFNLCHHSRLFPIRRIGYRLRSSDTPKPHPRGRGPFARDHRGVRRPGIPVRRRPQNPRWQRPLNRQRGSCFH
jgi:hypothetical protein